MKLVSDLAIQEVRAWLDQALPRAFHPYEFRRIDFVPLLPNGKIDRKSALASSAPFRTAPSAISVESEQLSLVEQTILSVWREVLGKSVIPTDVNFFELGGNSLILVRSFNRLQSQFGSLRTVVDLFRYPTIKQLAQHIEKLERESLHIN